VLLSTIILSLVLVQSADVSDRFIAAQKALAANPASEERLVALVSILYENDRNAAAISLLEPFVRARPRASRAKLFLALGYARQEKYSQAKTLASQVATQLPNDYYAQHILGLSLFGLNDFDAALVHFKKAVSIKPDFADGHFQLGSIYSRTAETLTDAETAFKRSLELGYSSPEIFRNLGSVDIKLAKYDDAVTHLKRALELNPNYADAYFQLADALRRSGNIQEAAEATRKFQSLNSSAQDKKQRDSQGRALYEDGLKRIEKDDLPGAHDTFKRAVETLPQLDAGYYRLAQIDYLRNNGAAALENIRRAIQLNPFEAEYFFVLARVLERSDPQGATEAIGKAISLNGRVGDFHNLLGNLYAARGDYSRATQSYRRAVDLEPKNEAFRMNLSAAQRKLQP
jgi:tetratricopeptide (TPR) repeat protein